MIPRFKEIVARSDIPREDIIELVKFTAICFGGVDKMIYEKIIHDIGMSSYTKESYEKTLKSAINSFNIPEPNIPEPNIPEPLPEPNIPEPNIPKPLPEPNIDIFEARMKKILERLNEETKTDDNA